MTSTSDDPNTDKKIYEFLAEKSRTSNIPIMDYQFASEFKTSTKAVESINVLYYRYIFLKNGIYALKDFDLETKIRMLFVSGAHLQQDFLIELQKNAVVEVDQKRRITKYEAKDGSLNLNGEHCLPSNRKSILAVQIEKCIQNLCSSSPNVEVDREIMSILRFVFTKCQNSSTVLTTKQLCEQFQEENQPSDSICIYKFSKIIAAYREEIHKMKCLDNQTKLKHSFVLGVPLEPEFFQELQKDDGVLKLEKPFKLPTEGDNSEENGIINESETELKLFELDRNGLINLYESNENKRNSIGRQTGVLQKTDKIKIDECDDDITEKETYDSFIEFISEKCENCDPPLQLSEMCTEYREKVGSTDDWIQSFNRFQERITKYRSDIPLFPHLDIRTKVRKLFALGVRLFPKILAKLRKNASVVVDKQNRITKYRAHDGSLELTGQHNNSRNCGATVNWLEIYKRAIEQSNRDGHFDERLITMVRFLSKKCENASSQLHIKHTWEEFSAENGVLFTLKRFSKFLSCYRRKIPKLIHMDTHTKVKQMFALRAPVESDFFQELQKEASVTLDYKQQIAVYTSNDGRLNLGRDYRIVSELEYRPKREVFDDYEYEETDDEWMGDESETEMNLFDLKTRSGRQVRKRNLVAEFLPDVNNRAGPSEGKKIRIKEEPKLNLTKYDDNAEIGQEDWADDYYPPYLSPQILKFENEDGLTIVPDDSYFQEEDQFDEVFDPIPFERPESSLYEIDMENGIETDKSLDLGDLPNEREMLFDDQVSSCDEDVGNPSNKELIHNEDSYSEWNPNSSETIITEFRSSKKSYSQKQPSIVATETLIIEKPASNASFIQESKLNNASIFSTPSNEVHKTEETLNKPIPLKAHKKFLEAIQHLISTFKLNINESVQNRIQMTLNEMESNRNSVLISDIHTAVNACLLIVSKTSISSSEHESRSLWEFIVTLRTIINSLRTKELASLQETLKILSAKFCEQDKKIQLEKLQSAIATIIDIIAP